MLISTYVLRCDRCIVRHIDSHGLIGNSLGCVFMWFEVHSVHSLRRKACMSVVCLGFNSHFPRRLYAGRALQHRVQWRWPPGKVKDLPKPFQPKLITIFVAYIYIVDPKYEYYCSADHYSLPAVTLDIIRSSARGLE